MFNDYFAEQCRLPIHAEYHLLPEFSLLADSTLDLFTLNEWNILEILKHLPSNKATGPDDIGNFILKSTAVSIFKPLCKLFNYSLNKKTFPKCWKIANVTPVFKKNEKMFCKNYRPISLLNNISKVFEQGVYDKLNNYFTTNNLLNPKNAGFKKGDNTTNQLLYITDKISASLDNGHDVRMVFLDAAQAFDKIWHKGLLFKLAQLGVSADLVQWFQSYLTGRHQRVVINGTASSILYLETGVPQGSILAPLLFLVYINDITSNIESDINLFADDTSLLDIVDKPDSSSLRLNRDLETINAWATQWLVTFNASKTDVITFSTKRNSIAYPPLYLNNVELATVDSHSHLGLTLTKNLSWKEHINKVVLKAMRRVNIIKRLKFFLGRKSLTHIYITMIRPILEYGCILYDNCTRQESELLESVQYEAARVCIGALWNTSKIKLLQKLGWCSLSIRRRYYKLYTLFKIRNNLVPPYISQGRLLLVSDVTNYNLRNEGNLRPLRAKTNKHMRSFFPSSVKEWNDLPPNIWHISETGHFKTSLASHLFPAKTQSYFHYGERFPSIYHTQLRLEHSPLNSHMHKYNQNAVPTCTCGSNESTEHFFLYCPKYAALRPALLSSIARLISPGVNYNLLLHSDKKYFLNVLLWGSCDLSTDDNTAIFAAVQHYIKYSRRFSFFLPAVSNK